MKTTAINRMNMKTMGFGIFSLIYGALYLGLYLGKYYTSSELYQMGPESSEYFRTIFIYLIIILLGVSLLLSWHEWALYIEYSIVFIGYALFYFIFFPVLDTSVEVGIISFIIQAPIVLFLLFHIHKFRRWESLSDKIMPAPRWAFFKFWITFTAFCILCVGFVFFFLPDYHRYFQIFIIPGLYFTGAYFMFAAGVAAFNVIKKEDPYTDPNAWEMILFMAGILLPLFYFFNLEGLGRKITSLLFLILQFAMLVVVYLRTRSIPQLFNNLMEYNPLRPKKNWFNRGLATVICAIMIFGAFLYLIFVAGVSHDLIPIPSWESFLGDLNVSQGSSTQIPLRDPFIGLYFLSGICVDFFNTLFLRKKNP